MWSRRFYCKVAHDYQREFSGVKAVDSLGIVVTKYVFEDDGFDFVTLHLVSRYTIKFLYFHAVKKFERCEKALHTGIVVAVSSTAQALNQVSIKL